MNARVAEKLPPFKSMRRGEWSGQWEQEQEQEQDQALCQFMRIIKANAWDASHAKGEPCVRVQVCADRVEWGPSLDWSGLPRT